MIDTEKIPLTEADTAALAEKGIIKKADRPVKVLGNGKLTKKLTVKLDAFSASAAEKINSVGGKAEVNE